MTMRLLGAALLCAALLAVTVHSQENALKSLSQSLQECYNEELYRTWNQLPHNIETLIEIIRKIEDHSSRNADLLNMRYLSTAILHRFRQDGVVRNPHVHPREGVLPYAPLGKQFYRHAQTLRVIPGNAFNFPNESLSAVERCTLHSMLSSSIDMFERGDESRVCKYGNYAFRRFGRSADAASAKEEVETLSPEQLEMMSGKSDAVDPNSMYPAFPRNHPRERLVNNPISKCPIENGVLLTPWGTVSGGAIIAGIAAGIESQTIRIDELIKQQVEPRVSGYASDILLDNKFLATLAGDLAEVALKQGPQNQNNRYFLGAEGSWNSSVKSLFYFLSSNENLEMTGAEIRGDIDGIILASKVPYYYERSRNFRLSQALDMYYGERGLFDRNLKACKRRDHLLAVAPTETLQQQTLSAAILLSPEIAPATFTLEAVERFVKQAVEDLSSHIPTMNGDESCEPQYAEGRPGSGLISEPAANLTIVIDTTWPFETINKILTQLVGSRHLHVSKFNSQYTLVSGADGSLVLNSSHSHLDLQFFNQTVYNRLQRGFDLPKTLDKLRRLQTENLNREQRTGWGGGKSDVVVVIPYQSSLSKEDKDYCNETLKKMQEDVPDATFLFLTYGSKDRWFDVVVNPDTDIISLTTGESSEYFPAVDTLVTRIKQVPRRLVNTQCAASYEKLGSSQPLRDAVTPGGVNYYRLQPNYFFTDSDSQPKVKIQMQDANSLLVCASRELLHENTTDAQARAQCVAVSAGRAQSITLDCDGASYIHQCKPFYFSVAANASATTSFSCSDPMKCRYPDTILFTISYEDLVCRNGATAMLVAPIALLVAVVARCIY